MGVCGCKSAGSKKAADTGSNNIQVDAPGGHNYPTAPTSQMSEGYSQKQDRERLEKAKRDAEDLLAACQTRLQKANLMLQAREDEVKILQQMLNKPDHNPQELNPEAVRVQFGVNGLIDDRAYAIQHGFPAILQETIDAQKAIQMQIYEGQLKKMRDKHSKQIETILAQFELETYEGQSASVKTSKQARAADMKAHIQQQHQEEIQQFEAESSQELREAESKAINMVLEVATKALGIK